MNGKQIPCKLASMCKGKVSVLCKERCPWTGVLRKGLAGKREDLAPAHASLLITW